MTDNKTLLAAIERMCGWCPDCRGTGLVTHDLGPAFGPGTAGQRVAVTLGCRTCHEYRVLAGLPVGPLEVAR